MSKFFGFLLGIVVALLGPAMFGVLTAEGGVELNAKEMALAYGIGALIFWIVASYFSGAGALGAALTFGVMIYAVHWIPNRMTNFLNDVPGVTSGMIDGVKEYTLNGMVPVLAVISLIFGIQLIVQAVQRRRRLREEDARLRREQELAAEEERELSAAYPMYNDYPTSVDNRYGDPYGDEPAPFSGRSSAAEEQTAQLATTDEGPPPEEDRGPSTDDDDTTQIPTGESGADETTRIPTNESGNDDTTQVPTEEPGRDEADTQPVPADQPTQVQPQSGDRESADDGRNAQFVAEPAGSQPVSASLAPAQSAATESADRTEGFGQQYRERMDDPDSDDTGGQHFQAIETPAEQERPGQNRPQGPHIVDLPGQFRPAGA